MTEMATHTDAAAALHTVEVTINGQKRAAPVEARMLLVDFIRSRSGLTGTAHRLRHDATAGHAQCSSTGSR